MCNSYGIYLLLSSNNNFSSNFVNTSGPADYGVFMVHSSNADSFSNNTICTYFANVIEVGNISSENVNANNSATFTNDVINCLGSCNNSFFVNQSSNITLVNVTFNFSAINVSGVTYPSDGNLLPSWANVSWFIQANVTNSTGPVANSYVNFTNVTGATPFIKNVVQTPKASPPGKFYPVLRQPVVQPEFCPMERYC